MSRVSQLELYNDKDVITQILLMKEQVETGTYKEVRVTETGGNYVFEFVNQKDEVETFTVPAKQISGVTSSQAGSTVTMRINYNDGTYQDVSWTAGGDVTTNTDQNITAIKTIARNTPELDFKDMNLDVFNVQGGTQFSILVFKDKNDVEFGRIRLAVSPTRMRYGDFYLTDGNGSGISVLRAECDENGTARAIAPTPDASNVSQEVATTAWAAVSAALLHTFGNENASGNKTFQKLMYAPKMTRISSTSFIPLYRFLAMASTTWYAIIEYAQRTAVAYIQLELTTDSDMNITGTKTVHTMFGTSTATIVSYLDADGYIVVGLSVTGTNTTISGGTPLIVYSGAGSTTSIERLPFSTATVDPSYTVI